MKLQSITGIVLLAPCIPRMEMRITRLKGYWCNHCNREVLLIFFSKEGRFSYIRSKRFVNDECNYCGGMNRVTTWNIED